MFIGLGKMASGEIAGFDGHEAAHQIVIGQTRSGKSITNYFLLSQVAFDPLIAVIGLDASGLTLAPFADSGQDFVVTGSADVTHYAVVLENAVALMDYRTVSMRQLGVDNFVPSETAPTVLVLLEEYAGVLAACDAHDASVKPVERIKPRVLGAVGRLLREGAKTQILVWTVIQRPDAAVVGGADRAQYARRVTHRVDSAEAVKMLNESATDADMARVLSFAPGVGLLNEPGRPYRYFRSAYLTYADYVERVKARYIPKNFIFDGLGADAGNQAQDDARAAKAKRIGDG